MGRGWVYRRPFDYRVRPNQIWTPVPVAGPQVFERTATDGVLLSDILIRFTELELMDRLYIAIPPTPYRTIEDTHFESVLLSDTAFRALLRQVVVVDQVLLSDRRIAAIDRVILDAVLVADVGYRAIEKILLDKLLVADTVVSPAAAGNVFTVQLTDGLFMLDRMLKTEEHAIRDSLLLSDLTIRQLIKQLLASDTLLISDTRASDRVLTFQDQMLVSDLAQRIRDLLIREGLYVSDTATATYEQLAAIVEALVFARLTAVDLLGASTGTDDWMGQRTDVTDWMGIITKIVKPPIVH